MKKRKSSLPTQEEIECHLDYDCGIITSPASYHLASILKRNKEKHYGILRTAPPGSRTPYRRSLRGPMSDNPESPEA